VSLSTAIKEKIMTPTANASAVFECTRLAHRFCCLADQPDAAGLASLFTPNGKFERGDLRVEGRAEIEKMTALRPAGMVTRHLLTTSLVEPIGDDAAGGGTTAWSISSAQARASIIPLSASIGTGIGLPVKAGGLSRASC
jgi:hypothetical protein